VIAPHELDRRKLRELSKILQRNVDGAETAGVRIRARRGTIWITQRKTRTNAFLRHDAGDIPAAGLAGGQHRTQTDITVIAGQMLGGTASRPRFPEYPW
jgi:hypothetical protein